MKIRILGGPGSGKSTLATELGRKLQLPVLHIDDVYWLPNWEESSWERVRKIVEKFMSQYSSWIIDGNYSSIKDLTIPPATHIIVCRPPLYKHLWRLFWREIVRRSPYRFLPVTAPPKNVINSQNGPFSDIFILMEHAWRYYKSKAAVWINEIRQEYPHTRIYIKH